MNELIVQMDSKEFISTGIKKLDALLGGGIQKGFTTVFSSVPGTNIDIISKQFASSDNPIYITTDETKEDIINTMNEFSWDSSSIEFIDIAQKNIDNILKDEKTRASIYQKRSKEMLLELIKAGSDNTPPNIRDDKDYLSILFDVFSENGSRKIILNNLDFFLENYQNEDVLRTLKAGKANISKNKGALILIFTRGIHDIVLERQIELIADCVLELDVVKQGSSFERILSVKKIRNYAKKIGTASYDIDEHGFTIDEIERIL